MEFDTLGHEALSLMQSQSDHIFLTGRAGTGKSTLLMHFLSECKKNVVVLAPTGVAALNVGGVTIHRFFGLPHEVTPEIAHIKAKMRMKTPEKMKVFEQVQTIIIDEISMVRADLLDCIDVFLRTIRRSSSPFGGVKMIFVGDLCQLPPIVKREENEHFQTFYSSPYFFSSQVIRDSGNQMHTFQLEKIYRQSDPNFIEILNAIRDNSVRCDQLSALNSRVNKDFSQPEGSVYLAGKNAIVDQRNAQKLSELRTPLEVFEAEVFGKFQPSDYPTDIELSLKVGAQVMFAANDSRRRWANGTLGKVVDFIGDEVVVEIFGSGKVVNVSPHTWEVNRYVSRGDKLEVESIGSFVQIPLRLAWAVTIHKSQGKTFDSVIIDPAGGMFAHGQAYVALSRARSLEGLTLASPLYKSHVIFDRRVKGFLSEDA